jgi:hypothetical protein
MRNTWSILVLCAFGFLLVIICSGLFWFHLHWFELVDANTYYTVHIMYFSCSERKRNLFCFPTKSRSPYSRIWHHISSTYMRQFHHTLFFRSFPSTFLIFEFRENFLSPFKETAKLQIEKAIFKWTSLFLILQAWKKKNNDYVLSCQFWLGTYHQEPKERQQECWPGRFGTINSII